MHRFIIVAVGFALAIGGLAVPGDASAQDPFLLDCSGGSCTTTKYGLGRNPDFRKTEIPTDNFRWVRSDFGDDQTGVSYFFSRGSFGDSTDFTSCGTDTNTLPVPGQVLLREDDTCTPTAEGPTCVGGADDGLACGRVKNPDECSGGVCSPAGGCRVELPISDGGITDPTDTSELFISTFSNGSFGGIGDWQLSSATANNFGGSSQERTCNALSTRFNEPCDVDADCPSIDPGDPASCQACLDINIRTLPSMGTRFLLPASHPDHDGSGTQTYLRWDHGYRAEDVNSLFCSAAGTASVPGGTGSMAVACCTGAGTGTCTISDADAVAAARRNSTNFRIHTDDSAVCCNEFNPAGNNACSLLFQSPQPTYPDIIGRTCRLPRRWIIDQNVEPDWVFTGGAQSRFYTDPEFVREGQLTGQCENNRFVGCYDPAFNAACTAAGIPAACCDGPGSGTCGGECDALGDTCDFREPGHRNQVRCTANANGDIAPQCCGTSLYVLRGQPEAECSLTPRRTISGDPGADCGLINYRIDQRTDANCDGVADTDEAGGTGDLCPWLSEWNHTADADGDGRGDECECGDITEDGLVNVEDILGTNDAIFGGPLFRTCDSNNSSITAVGDNPPSGCDVGDILRDNASIFGTVATCRQVQPGGCGNGVVETGEACDAGAGNDDNGPCSTICELVP